MSQTPWLRTLAFGALLIHGYVSYVAWAEFGYAGAFPPFSQSNTTQIFSDLIIALVGVNIAVFYDMRARSVPVVWFAVHVLGTAISGSFAPILYVVFRPRVA